MAWDSKCIASMNSPPATVAIISQPL